MRHNWNFNRFILNILWYRLFFYAVYWQLWMNFPVGIAHSLCLTKQEIISTLFITTTRIIRITMDFHTFLFERHVFLDLLDLKTIFNILSRRAFPSIDVFLAEDIIIIRVVLDWLNCCWKTYKRCGKVGVKSTPNNQLRGYISRQWNY